jgi:7-cyano-7-deazaguanine tRNA-ribosyltransferase
MLGFDAIITNAYLAWKHYGDEARKKGIHEIINSDCIVMTDSGGYQVLEYGKINVEPKTIACFEMEIESDIAVPLDKPTGFGLEHAKAKNYVEDTLKNAKETLELVKSKDSIESNAIDHERYHKAEPIWVGPIQGGEHLDLVKYSSMTLDKMGYELMAIGSPVEVMERYEFSILSEMIVAAKSSVPNKPFHLFGAGHPLTIPLIVALGCDTFDSASYILYAKEDRYMHANGTIKLQDLSYFPCSCSVCSKFTTKELLQVDKDQRIIELGLHNLHVIKSEVSAVKQAIIDGRLWEHVFEKGRAHPKLMDALHIFKNLEVIKDGTPKFKKRAIFLFEPFDQYRPEAERFRVMVYDFKPANTKQKLVLYPEVDIHPFYATTQYRLIKKRLPDAQVCTYNRFLGVIPAEISDIFPAAHNLSPKNYVLTSRVEDYPTFKNSLEKFLSRNSFKEVIIVADEFIKEIIKDPNLKALCTKIVDFNVNAISKL